MEEQDDEDRQAESAEGQVRRTEPVAHAGDAHDVAALLKADGVLDDVVRGVLL